jgi:sirohydrochlorin cobaltochelatase
MIGHSSVLCEGIIMNKLRSKTTNRVPGFYGIFLLVALSLSFTGATAQDHSNHEHGGGVPDMDADGKRLASYQVKHDMDEETLAALRAKIALYRGMTDRELNMNMSAMGPNYEWYASDLGLYGDVGVLILSHGVGENSDRLMKEALAPLSSEVPTAIGFGMAMMTSGYLQSAVDDLVERGAKTIVLVQNGTTTKYNTLTRQWSYIFDLGDEATYLAVDQVKADGVKFVMSDAMGDNQLVTDMLYDHVKEVSKNPANEVVIIVGHGPEDGEDNIPDLEIIGAHAERIKARNEFADVKIINLQDDAIPPVRKSNVKRLRRWVSKADGNGQDVIIVAIAAASYGVQQHIIQDLHGLNYTFAEKGMSEHPSYIKLIEVMVEDTIALESSEG